MNILITGGAGFIGSRFIHYMLAKYPEYRIICLDKLTYAGDLATLQPVIKNPRFYFVKADICDKDLVAGLFAEEHPDLVVNFAAESHVDRAIASPDVFCIQILEGPEFCWMHAASMEMFIFIRFPQMRCTGICRLG